MCHGVSFDVSFRTNILKCTFQKGLKPIQRLYRLAIYSIFNESLYKALWRSLIRIARWTVCTATLPVYSVGNFLFIYAVTVNILVIMSYLNWREPTVILEKEDQLCGSPPFWSIPFVIFLLYLPLKGKLCVFPVDLKTMLTFETAWQVGTPCHQFQKSMAWHHSHLNNQNNSVRRNVEYFVLYQNHEKSIFYWNIHLLQWTRFIEHWTNTICFRTCFMALWSLRKLLAICKYLHCQGSSSSMKSGWNYRFERTDMTTGRLEKDEDSLTTQFTARPKKCHKWRSCYLVLPKICSHRLKLVRKLTINRG